MWYLGAKENSRLTSSNFTSTPRFSFVGGRSLIPVPSNPIAIAKMHGFGEKDRNDILVSCGLTEMREHL